MQAGAELQKLDCPCASVMYVEAVNLQPRKVWPKLHAAVLLQTSLRS